MSSSLTPTKKNIKVVVRGKKKPARKVGLPTGSLSTRTGQNKKGELLLVSSETKQSEHVVGGDSQFPLLLDDFFPSMQDIPCDTLLLMRSMEQNRTCLDVPLPNGAIIPVVLESQLRSRLTITKLTGEGGLRRFSSDSTVTQELQDLQKSNHIRRLVPASLSEGAFVAWVETKHFVRAVWMVVAPSCQNPETLDHMAVQVTTWFLSNLRHWTNRHISRDAMKKMWREPAGLSLDQAIDWLVHMQLLLPFSSTYLLWLPLWGSVLAAIDKAQTKVMQHIKRSMYKELSIKTIDSQSHRGGLSGSFVLHMLEAQGKIEVVQRSAGKFARIAKNETP